MAVLMTRVNRNLMSVWYVVRRLSLAEGSELVEGVALGKVLRFSQFGRFLRVRGLHK